MEPKGNARPGPQVVEIKSAFAGKRPRRLKAKHLANSTRELIVRLFAAYESYDDVAREMDFPGLTGKTVSEVIHAWIMKPPANEKRALAAGSGPFLVRRAA